MSDVEFSPEVIDEAAYEAEVRAKIEDWKHADPGLLAIGTGFVINRLGNAFGRFVPGSAMQAALNLGNEAGKFTSRWQNLLGHAEVESYAKIRELPLSRCDELAGREMLWAMGAAGAEGGLTGALGFAGMAVDIPVIITFAARSVHLTGLCYGFELDRGADRGLVLAVLGVSGANDHDARMAAVATLDSMVSPLGSRQRGELMRELSEDTFGQQAILHTGKRLARDLAGNLAKRKLAQAVPFVGSVVGATVNAWYIRDVCIAAQRTFQERWLRHHGKWERCSDQRSGPIGTVDAELVE